MYELSGANPGAVCSVHPSGFVIGRSAVVDLVVRDSSVSWEHAALTTRRDGIYVEDLRSLNGTFVNDRRVERPVLLANGDYLRFGGRNTIFKFSMMGEFEENVHRTLFALTVRDSLTHLFNRRHFEERLHGEFALAERQRATLSVLLLDIDRFKTVNARFGHHVGDAVLKLIAISVQKMMRPEDVVARLDGGKFAVSIQGISTRNAEILTERVRRRVAEISLEPNIRGLILTVSAGLSSVGPREYGVSSSALFGRAEQALQEATAGGGNRFCPASREHA
ncbi:MAG TPA: GGDEF domain-containing protein [Polyangiaceae bacterium]